MYSFNTGKKPNMSEKEQIKLYYDSHYNASTDRFQIGGSPGPVISSFVSNHQKDKLSKLL